LLNKISSILIFLFFALTTNAQTTVVFNCTGGSQNFVVPPCVTSIDVIVTGAQGGGSAGGLGASVTGSIPVTPGQTLQIDIGCTPTGTAAGYNGGGSGQNATSAGDPSFGGGGGSGISIAPFGPANQVIVAGGGGGTGGGTEDGFGGAGGCNTGSSGDAPFGQGGFGGSQGAGGAGGPDWNGSGNFGSPGGLGFGGAGATDPCNNNSPGGGGGGGYYGGGGGGSDCFASAPYGGGGGGGGSSLTPVGGICTAATNAGSGSISITYTAGVGVTTASNTGPYCIGDLIQLNTSGIGVYSWTGPLGFTSATQNPTIAGATAAMGGVYTVTVTAPGGCVSTDTTMVVVNSPPTANVPANTTYCNGDLVPVGAFTSTPIGGTFAWTNTDPTIGLAAAGVGNTPAFNAINLTGAPIVATINVTPTLGCVGAPANYTITINPTPAAPTVANVNICANNTANLTATAPGGTYNWFDAAIAGNLLFTGANYTTPVLVANTSYWVETTVNGCTSPRTMVTVTISAALVVNAGLDQTICNGVAQPLTVTPNGAGFNYIWDEPGNLGFSAIFNPIVNPVATTSYTVTVTDASGCIGYDTVIVNVDPIPTANVTANATYCPGDPVPASAYTSTPAGGTFTWTNTDPTIGLAAAGAGNTPAFNATNLTGAAIVATVSVTPTLNGCVGLPVNYTITINPTPTAPTALDVTICTNNSTNLTATAPGGTYEWYDAAVGGTLLFTGATYTTPVLIATTSYWVQTTVNGCLSPRSMVTVTVALNLVVDAGANDTICNGDIQPLIVTPNGVGYTYVWDEPGNLGFSGVFNPNVSPTTTTMYTVLVTDATGCFGTDSVEITVNPIPTVTVSANAIYCSGDPVPTSAFTSTPIGATFDWTNTDITIGLAGSGSGNTPPFNASNGTGAPITSTISVTPTLNNCVGLPVNYTITVNPIPTMAVPSSNTYCNGDPILTSIFASTPAGGTFTWTNTDPTIGLAAAGTGNTPAFNATNNSGAPVTATITVTPTVNGCVGTAINYTITISSPITINNVITDVTCNGYSNGEVVVAPSGGIPNYSYSWTAPGIGDSPLATGLFAGPVTVTVTDANGCSQDSTFTLTEPPAINYIDFGADIYAGCAPLDVEFYNLTNPALITGISWNLGNGSGGTNDTVSTTYNSPGTYDVALTVTDNNGCVATLTEGNYITIYENPIPNFSNSPDHVTLFNPTMDFVDLSQININSWNWNFDGLGNSTDPNPSFTFPEDTGTYVITLSVENSNGCIDSIKKIVKIYGEFGIFVPNAFTPDFDNLNDGFAPKGFGIANENYSFMIFDRWGELLYETDDVDGFWNGTYKGKIVKNDVYVWKLTFVDLEGLNHKKTGQVNLVK
jgi:gliding motility-associated-like protein